MTFGITFSINFPDRLNLVICNTYNAKTSFLPFQASHFSIKNRSTNHVFSKPFLGPPFSHFFRFFQKWSILGPPSKSDGVQNPLRVRGRTQQSVSGRFSPVAVSLSCTAPYLTSPFLYVISLGKCICRSPCDSRRAKRGVLGAADFKMGPKSTQISSKTVFFFQLFQKSRKSRKHCFYNGF